MYNQLPEARPSTPKFAIIAIIVLVLGIFTLFFLLKNRTFSYSSPQRIVYAPATQVYTPGKAVTLSVANITVYVPADATNLQGTFSIIQRDPTDFVDANTSDWTRPQIVNVEYLDESGSPYSQVIFFHSIEVCFNLAPVVWRDYGLHPDHYLIQYYAEDQTPPYWQTLAMTTHVDRSQLCGLSPHLSTFGLAAYEIPQIPITGATAIETLNPTQISATAYAKSRGGGILTPILPTPVPSKTLVPSRTPVFSQTPVPPTATTPPVDTATQPPVDTATQPPADTATNPPADTATNPPVATNPPEATNPPATQPPTYPN